MNATDTRETKLDAWPAWMAPVRELLLWSDNYEAPTPWDLFLDLIGWSGEHFECVAFFPYAVRGSARYAIAPLARAGVPERDALLATAHAELIDARFGYLECAQLGTALVAYAERPGATKAFITELDDDDEAEA